MNYTIQTVSPPKPFTTQNGDYLSYWLGLAEFTEDRVELVQKPATAPPQAGQVLAGDITQKPNGIYKLTKNQQATQQAGYEQKAEVMEQRHGYDELDHRITRQHSQEMAIRFLALVAGPDRSEIGFGDLLPVVDWFDADAWKSRNPQQQFSNGASQPTNTAYAPSYSGPNGPEPRKVSPAQLEKFLRPRMANVDATSMRALLDRFHVGRIEDLPMSEVDSFARALTEPIRTGESDLPSPEPLPVRQVEESFPF